MKPPRLLQKFARIPRTQSAAAETVSDQLLVERYVIERNEEAFTELVRRHAAMVASVCQRGLQQRHDAEDAFQTTFFILARDAGRIVKRESLGSWLFGVALRVTKKVRSLHARQPVTNAVEGTLAMAPERSSADDQTATAIEEVAFLPQRYRMPVVLCWLEGRTQQEAAELLGWPIGSVAGRLSRAKELLRLRLLRRGLETTALTTLFGLADAASLSAEQIKQTVQMALSQTQGRRVLALAQGGSSMVWSTTLMGGLLLITGVGVWWGTQGKEPKTEAAVSLVTSPVFLSSEKNEVTSDMLQGEWILEEGSWGLFHWQQRNFSVMFKKDTMSFLPSNDEEVNGPTHVELQGELQFFQQKQVWHTPLHYQLGRQGETTEFNLEFPYPGLFQSNSNLPTAKDKPAVVFRDGLIRFRDGALELVIACKNNPQAG